MLYFAFPGRVSVSGGERCPVLELPHCCPHRCAGWGLLPCMGQLMVLAALCGAGQGTNVALKHLHNEQSISVGSAELQQGSNAASPL